MKSGLIKISSDLTVFYRESGLGTKTVVFIPGWTMSTEVFERQLEFFDSTTDYRFITYDPRAHGQSSNSENGHFYEQHGRDLHTLIQSLELDEFVLGGWSFGTLAMLSYLDQFGADKLAGLIMLDGPPRAAGPDTLSDWVTYSYDDEDGSQEFFTMGKLRDRHNTNIAFAQWMLEDTSPDNVEWLTTITNQMPDTSASLLNATSIFLDYRELLISLNGTLPLLYYVREEKQQVVTKWSEQNTPAARVYASGKHMMFWERADEFNRELVCFLELCNRDKRF